MKLKINILEHIISEALHNRWTIILLEGRNVSYAVRASGGADRRQRGKLRVSKRLNDKSIDFRPAQVTERIQFEHWESDTMLGRKRKGEPAVFTIVERLTGHYLCIRADDKTTTGVTGAMRWLHRLFGSKFSQVFRSITNDNGGEFADFSSFEAYGTEVYFAYPYSAGERPVNERTNRILRRFIPKGKSIAAYSHEQILAFADEINALSRKRFGYHTPEELFEAQLDQIHSSFVWSALFCLVFNLLLQFSN